MLNIIDTHAVGYETTKEAAKQLGSDRDRMILAYVLDNQYEECLREIRELEPEWAKLERSYAKKYSTTDSSRASERSQFISHVTQSVVDDNVAELTDAIFGTGRWFDLSNDTPGAAADERIKVEDLANRLDTVIRNESKQAAVEEAAFLGELLGTGILETSVSIGNVRIPTQQPDGSFGVTVQRMVDVKTAAIQPRHFRIPRGCRSLAEAPWLGVENFQPAALYTSRVKSGTFTDVYNGRAPDSPYWDQTSREDALKYNVTPGYFLMLRWYGCIPMNILDPKSSKTDMVDCMVVIANREAVLYAGENPYMTKDKPFSVYRPATRPGTFWGIGCAEKVAETQAATDRHFRTHEDALAFTAYPVTGMNALGVPKSFKLSIKPGTNILFNGDPNTVFKKLDFGQPQTASFETASALIQWGVAAGGIQGSTPISNMADAKSGAMAIAVGPVLKKIKQRVRKFQNDLIVPMIRQIAYRFMQFDPQTFPSFALGFKVHGSSSMAEREFEQQRYISAMSQLSPESPLQGMMMANVVRMGQTKDRESVAAQMEEFAKEQQMQKTQDTSDQVMKQITLRSAAAKALRDEAEAERSMGEAKKATAEADHVEARIKADIFKAMVTNSDPKTPDDVEFDRRYKAMELIIKEMAVNQRAEDSKANERITRAQMSLKNGDSALQAQDELDNLLNNVGAQ